MNGQEPTEAVVEKYVDDIAKHNSGFYESYSASPFLILWPFREELVKQCVHVLLEVQDQFDRHFSGIIDRRDNHTAVLVFLSVDDYESYFDMALNLIDDDKLQEMEKRPEPPRVPGHFKLHVPQIVFAGDEFPRIIEELPSLITLSNISYVGWPTWLIAAKLTEFMTAHNYAEVTNDPEFDPRLRGPESFHAKVVAYFKENGFENFFSSGGFNVDGEEYFYMEHLAILLVESIYEDLGEAKHNEFLMKCEESDGGRAAAEEVFGQSLDSLAHSILNDSD